MTKIKAIILVLIFMFLLGCNKKTLNEYSDTFHYLDTDIKIKIYTSSSEKADKVLKDIKKIYMVHDKIINRNNSNSEISYIYRNNLKDEKIKVSNEMSNLIKYGINLYQDSDGLLSINTGDLIDIWNDSYSNQLLPDKKILSNIDTGIEKIKINNNILDNNHLNLSFDQFIRGYTHSLVKKYLDDMNIDYYFISTNAEILAGKEINNEDYTVVIVNPFNDGLLKTLRVKDKYITTKSIYHNNYKYDDEIYSNLVNAKDKMMGNKMVSVTVISNAADIGDMVANMLFLMNYEDGLEIAEKYNVKVIWCYYDKNNNEIIKMTDNI